MREDCEDHAPLKSCARKNADSGARSAARGLNELVVLHSRRAPVTRPCILGSGSKWLTKVLVMLTCPRCQFHEIDAAAGRIHLFVPQGVGGAGGRQKPQWTHSSINFCAVHCGRRKTSAQAGKNCLGRIWIWHQIPQ